MHRKASDGPWPLMATDDLYWPSDGIGWPLMTSTGLFGLLMASDGLGWLPSSGRGEGPGGGSPGRGRSATPEAQGILGRVAGLCLLLGRLGDEWEGGEGAGDDAGAAKTSQDARGSIGSQLDLAWQEGSRRLGRRRGRRLLCAMCASASTVQGARISTSAPRISFLMASNCF